ncbi:MAG: hypothetical protein WBG31_05680 [Marinomonas sp.]
MVFYLKHKSKVPYYRLNQSDCTVLLEKAVNGVLLEYDWNVFIGMTIRDNEQFERLREVCLMIDDEHKKGAQLIGGKLYVRFSKAGVKQLASLLDEWRHKVHYAA